VYRSRCLRCLLRMPHQHSPLGLMDKASDF
jgi:hypothetical protein